MKVRREPFAVVLAFALSCTAALVAQQPPDQKDKKQDDAQKKEIQSVVKVVDDVAAGQPAPNDFDIKWVREDILKAQGNKEYVPFTVSIDPSKITGGNVAFYWRVVAKGGDAAPAAVAPGKKDDKKDDKKDNKKKDYAYEDISFIPVTAGQK